VLSPAACATDIRRNPTMPPTAPTIAPTSQFCCVPAIHNAAPHNPPVTIRAHKPSGTVRLGVLGSLSETNSAIASSANAIADGSDPSQASAATKASASRDVRPTQLQRAPSAIAIPQIHQSEMPTARLEQTSPPSHGAPLTAHCQLHVFSSDMKELECPIHRPVTSVSYNSSVRSHPFHV
jgi:hypothetical protein